jgi:hypothetical protein
MARFFALVFFRKMTRFAEMGFYASLARSSWLGF